MEHQSIEVRFPISHDAAREWKNEENLRDQFDMMADTQARRQLREAVGNVDVYNTRYSAFLAYTHAGHLNKDDGSHPVDKVVYCFDFEYISQ
jgi:hypothetical protein